MKTDDNGTRIALQPESQVEQELLAELFARLNNIAEAPNHPTKVGSRLVYYTLDIPEYPDLNQPLAEEASCDVNEDGRLDPEPGSRAMVVIYEPEVEHEADEPDQSAVDEAVEELSEGDEREETITTEEVAERIITERPLDSDSAEYDTVKSLARDANATGVTDIALNISHEEMVEALDEFVEVVLPEEPA